MNKLVAAVILTTAYVSCMWLGFWAFSTDTKTDDILALPAVVLGMTTILYILTQALIKIFSNDKF